MLYWKEGKLNLSPYKVNYTQHGKQEVAYTDDKKWWEDFAEKWEHTTIQSFEDMEYTPGELQRYEEIKYMPEGHAEACKTYVKSGDFPEGINHALRHIQLQKENERLGIELSEREISEIVQGTQISELEIKLLEMEMGGMCNE